MLLPLSFLLYIPKILFGFCLAHTIWREPSRNALWLKVFLGVNLGMGFWSLGYFLWLLAGLNRLIFPWLEITISSIIVVICLRSFNPRGMIASTSLRSILSPLNLATLLACTITATLLAMRIFMNPHGHEDAWFIWNLNARFIYFAQDFRILYINNGPGWHPDYPLLLSLNGVSGWALLGQASTRVPMAVATLFTITLPRILFFGLAVIKDSKQAALATIALLSSSMIVFYGASQEADIPLSSFILASLTLIAIYFKTGEKRLLILAGLTTCMTAWVKNEGFLFLLVVSALLATFLIISRQFRDLKSYFAGALFPSIVVLAFKVFIPVTNDLFVKNTLPQLLDWNRYAVIMASLAKELAILGHWKLLSLPAVLIVYALLVGSDQPRPTIVKFIALALALQLCGYFFVYVLSPHDLAWHLLTSLERLLLHLFPSALLLLFYSIKPPNFSFGKNNNSREDLFHQEMPQKE